MRGDSRIHLPRRGPAALASRASHVSNWMFMAAATAFWGMSPMVEDQNGKLLPPMDELRAVAVAVAAAAARQVRLEGLAP